MYTTAWWQARDRKESDSHAITELVEPAFNGQKMFISWGSVSTNTEVLFSMHKNRNVKVRMLWLRMVLNNILWHLKATLLSFTSSLFIVWAFYELCAWTRPKSWVPHSKSYGTSVSLTKDVVGFCISKSSSRHTLTFSGKNGKCCIHALSQQGQFCSHPMGAGGRTEPQSTGGHQIDGSLLFGHLFPWRIFKTG